MKKYECGVCGETDPNYFYESKKSKCKCCILGVSKEKYNPHKHIRKNKPYHCLTCGETDSSKFYASSKIACKACQSTTTKEYNPHKTAFFIDENGVKIKIHLCVICGETDPEYFNKGCKSKCATCQREHNRVISKKTTCQNQE